MKKLFVIGLITSFCSLKAQGPVQLNLYNENNNTIENLVRSLEGPGVEILNITTNQKKYTNQLCSFQDNTQSLGMSRGLILSTGSVRNIIGKNVYTGMTGVTQQLPNAIMDTVQQYVPCIINGKKPVLENMLKAEKVKLTEGKEASKEFILDGYYKKEQKQPLTLKKVLSFITQPFVNTDSLDILEELQSYSSEIFSEKDTIQEGTQMCMQTYIIPKKSNFVSSVTKDPDLSNEVGKNTRFFDACIVEMDIVPKSNVLSFRYLFGSEEYDEYVCSPFNDAFAFFLSGPGIDGKQNLATIQNTGRITINSVNKGNPYKKRCKYSNPSFYNKNKGQLPLEYDGFTRTMEINKKVKKGEKYHLKIIIADASDGIYDSGVFIENNSMISYSEKVVLSFKSSSIQTDVKELPQLLAMTKKLKLNTSAKVEISGHTDSQGTEEDNLKLSQKRIDNIVNYLIENGVGLSQIIQVNKGEHMPIASNLTPEGRQKNRRVEVKYIP